MDDPMPCEICGLVKPLWAMSYDRELNMWFCIECRTKPANAKYIHDLRQIQRRGCRGGNIKGL